MLARLWCEALKPIKHGLKHNTLYYRVFVQRPKHVAISFFIF